MMETKRLVDALDMPVYSQRALHFGQFAECVIQHIDNYTVPQYGDAPNDQVEQWSAAFCVENAKKYLNRFGRNRRPDQEFLDLLKAAHYIQLAYTKLQNSSPVHSDDSTPDQPV